MPAPIWSSRLIIPYSFDIIFGNLSLLKTPLKYFILRCLTKLNKSKLDNGLSMNFISTDRELGLCSIHGFVAVLKGLPISRLPYFAFRDNFLIPLPIGFSHVPLNGGIIGGYIYPPFNFAVGGVELG